MNSEPTTDDEASVLPRRLRVAIAIIGAAFVSMPFVPAPLALGLGALLGLVVGNPAAERTQAWVPRLLAVAIVGIGASVNLRDVAAVGARGALFTVVTVALCLSLGAALSKRFGIEPEIALLVAVGTAICGGTAIAAMAPIVRARREQTTVALGTVFMLNAVAMLVLPWIGRSLGLDASSFGTLAALAVHDTSAVVGAASSFGNHAVEIATTVKLARALYLVPVAFAVAAVQRTRAVDREAKRVHPPFPWFILGFVALSALVTFVPELRVAGDVVAALARRVMVVSLYLVGAGTTRAALRAAGIRPLALGGILWVVVCAASVTLVLVG